MITNVAPIWVRPPYSREFIECRCHAVLKDDCDCICKYLAGLDELTPAESERSELHGPTTAEEAKAHAKALESIICWHVDSDAIQLQQRHWAAVLAKREVLGRPLEADDLRSIVDADRGLDGND